MSKTSILHFIFITATLLHCSLASTGWFYRYEGYLLALGFLTLIPYISEWIISIQQLWFQSSDGIERWLVRMILIGVILLTYVPYSRYIKSVGLVIPAARNLFDQQYQMGLFIREYYSNQTIVLNDIGAVNYLADSYCIDLMGLGSKEKLLATTQNQWNSNFVEKWCKNRNAKIAMIYESWLGNLIPPSWIKVGEWIVNEKVSVADTKVSIYAVDQKETIRLYTHLKGFQPKLSKRVTSNLMVLDEK